MKEGTLKVLEELKERYPSLEGQEKNILLAFNLLIDTVNNGGTVFTCGNGGSASDSEHIVGELIKSFKVKRPLKSDFVNELKKFGDKGQTLINVLEGGIKSVALTSHLALSTAFANDKCPEAVFAQQLSVLGERGDTLIAISTSGNSKNCVLAGIVAKAMGIKVIALTGKNDSELSKIADCAIQVPETETYKVQELHLPIYHCLCAMLETEKF